MGTIKTTNIEPIADNGTVTLGSSGDQFTLATGAKSSFLYPAFRAYLSSDQTGLGSGTLYKVTFQSETYDTDNCFDSTTNYRFTPTVAGKYFFNYQVYVSSTGGASNLYITRVNAQKNGSTNVIFKQTF